ncbi:MAG: type II toxin-antitoxin system YoeB family toxin [Candidatus Contendobacter sp.]|nr:MAG: type II toxin-antitoxin system YoeB family toxin [Candidatus Contendobacter sp.]
MIAYIKPLKSKFAGYYWSRRIDDTDRLVYWATDDEWAIIACRFHYDG